MSLYEVIQFIVESIGRLLIGFSLIVIMLLPFILAVFYFWEVYQRG